MWGVALRRGALTCAGLLLAGPAVAGAQEEAPRPSGRVGFASMDVALGGTFIQDADAGISYGAGTDIANLFVRGALFRVGFRFWSADDPGGARVVEIDDFAVSLMLRRRFTDGGVSVYGGLGAALHFVAARFGDRVSEKERRDAFRPGVDAQLGIEFTLAEDGFVNVFAEGTGSLVDEVSHVSAQAGMRLRFDALGRR